MTRILYVLDFYPELSQTYIEVERQQVAGRAETFALARSEPILKNPDHLPYETITFWLTERLGKGRRRGLGVGSAARRQTPDVVHTHWLFASRLAAKAARACDVPWSVRTHSFDILERTDEQLRPDIRLCNEPDCVAVLAFPFLRERLLRLGLKEDKLIDAPPVVDAERFNDLGPNGPGVINTSAYRPKKDFGVYFRLSTLVPERPFSLYPLAQKWESAQELSTCFQGRVEIRPPVPHSRMLREWKRHSWLVYTGSHEVNSIGWPLAIAEAWAAGVGVCLQNVRPDLADYVGDCAILFDEVEELTDILKGPPDPAMRERAHARAMSMDIRKHMNGLYDAWRGAGVNL